MVSLRSTVIAAAGLLAAVALWSLAPAGAEVRRTTPPQAFSSGAMRSEVLLREIAGTLRTIDARLARLEAVAAAQRADAKGGVHGIP